MTHIDNNKAKDFLVIILLAIIGFLTELSFNYKILIISFGVLSLLFPILIKPILYAWLQIGKVLSYIVPPTLMAIIFYLIITPIGFLRKLLKGKNKLDLVNSNYIIRKQKIEKQDLLYPF